MAKATTMSNAAVVAEGNALVALLANGYLNIYTGTQPATADTAISGQVLLAALRFGSPAAPATPNSGVITFNAITSATAGATGTAAWFRCLESDNATGVMDGTVDVAGNSPNLVLGSTSITNGAMVSVSSFIHTISKTTAGD